MTDTPAQIMAQLLVDLGVASGPGGAGAWPVFTTNMPDRPDNAIQVKNTTGSDESDQFAAGDTDQHWGVQIMVRAADDRTAGVKAQAVRRALRAVNQRGVTPTTATQGSGARYTVPAVNEGGPPLALGTDRTASNRVLYTLNPTFPTTAEA